MTGDREIFITKQSLNAKHPSRGEASDSVDRGSCAIVLITLAALWIMIGLAVWRLL